MMPFHGRRNAGPDPLGGGLDLAVPDMSVSERHDRLRMTEHPGNGGQRNALRHGLARPGVSTHKKILQSKISDAGSLRLPVKSFV